LTVKGELSCISCSNVYDLEEELYSCVKCGSLLEIRLTSLEELNGRAMASRWSGRDKGVWRYKELIPIEGQRVSLREGGTPLYEADKAAKWAGVRKLYVKFEGLNPTGSFKDRGMTVSVSRALQLKKRVVVCASTGNTSSSMAAYAAAAGLKAVVVTPKSGVAAGKLFQTLLHGAKLLQIPETFDKALNIVLSTSLGSDAYILNSVNPWRIEGQKTVSFELWEEMVGNDYFLSVPVGNCGNISAIWKGLSELRHLGLLNDMPRLVAVQAEGASPFVDMVKRGDGKLIPVQNPSTVASAIRIGRPINWQKALKAVRESEGLVEKVSDNLIIEAQRVLASSAGLGVEPASAASLAGIKKLVEEGLIDHDATVVCIATGHALKDPQTEIVSQQVENITLSLDDLIKSV